MSLSNILQPNDYNLFCASITQSVPFTASKLGQSIYYLSAASQSIGNAVTGVKVLWDASFAPITGLLAAPFTQLNGVFTCTADCVVTATVQVRWTQNSTGARFVGIRKNSDSYIQAQSSLTGTSISDTTSADTQPICWSTCFAVGDT